MAIGLSLRALCVVLLTWGLMLYVNNAFNLACGGISLLLRALLPTMAFAFIMVGGKKGIVIGLGIGAFGAVITLVTTPDLIGCIKATFNSAMDHLVYIGYDNYEGHKFSVSDMGISKEDLHTAAFTVVGTALSLIFSLFTMRKTVLLPTLIVSIGILTLGFTFNTSTSNWGFAFALLALVGIIVMRMFDRTFKAKRKDRLKVAYLGGFVGGAVMLMATVAIIIPAIFVDEEWDDIKFISEPIAVARDIVDSVITGNAPNLKDMGIVKNMDDFNSRDVDIKNRKFTGESIIRVETLYNKDLPVYLRGWIGTAFDGRTWTTVTNDVRTSYLNRFEYMAKKAGYGEGAYRTEYMTEAFYQMVIPELTRIDEMKGYTNNYDNGFITMNLNIEIELGAGTGNLLYLPAISGSDTIYEIGEVGTVYDETHDSYFDGMLVTGWFNLDKEYTVKSYVPVMSSEKFADSLQNELKYFYAMRELIYWHQTAFDASELENKRAAVLSNFGLSAFIGEETYFERYMALPADEQEKAYYKYVQLTTNYTVYANETYGSGAYTYNELIDRYKSEILSELAPNATTHEKVLAVVRFLCENYKFNENPQLPVVYGGYDGFLRERREGYGVQLATTATLLLRSMGISTRYVEGYIAAKFDPDEENEDSDLYVCNVTDRQEHAWIEVYYDGLGWLPYETTEQYVKAYYGKTLNNDTAEGEDVPTGGGSSGGGSLDTDYAPDAGMGETGPVVDIPLEPIAEPFPTGKVLLIIVIVAGSGVLIFIAWRYLRDRAESALAERRKLINDAINGSVEDDELPHYAQELNYEIFRMFNLGGESPNLGELPMEYAQRLEKDSILGKTVPFTEVMSLMQKQEFGRGVSKAELAKIAEYLDSLWKDVYRTSGKAKRFWNRYLRCAI